LKFLRRRTTDDAAPTPPFVNADTLFAQSGEGSANESLQSATILQILRQRSAWGTFAGLFAYNYIWYFFITWLPFYLVRERQFSVQSMSVVSGLAFLVLAISALV